MPRFPTLALTFDDALQISIDKLKVWGYINSDGPKQGTLSWSNRGGICGKISIASGRYKEHPFIRLDYLHNDKAVSYTVDMVSVPSNLGKGEIWYFVCPYTNKRCRILYSIGEKFLHREAYKGYLYESQKQSKRMRQLDKAYGHALGSERLYEQLFQKHRKKCYAGKPTKRYARLMDKIERANQVPYKELERLYIM